MNNDYNGQEAKNRSQGMVHVWLLCMTHEYIENQRYILKCYIINVNQKWNWLHLFISPIVLTYYIFNYDEIVILAVFNKTKLTFIIYKYF